MIQQKLSVKKEEALQLETHPAGAMGTTQVRSNGGLGEPPNFKQLPPISLPPNSFVFLPPKTIAVC